MADDLRCFLCALFETECHRSILPRIEAAELLRIQSELAVLAPPCLLHQQGFLLIAQHGQIMYIELNLDLPQQHRLLDHRNGHCDAAKGVFRHLTTAVRQEHPVLEREN